jgi:GNAT superfamily N-acetyltransferase
MAAFSCRELTPKTWPDFERLFRGPGGNTWCWCMYYRRPQSAAREAAEYGVRKGGFPEHNRRRNEGLVREGRAHGILVYDEGEPVGWCAYGRREEFPAIDRGRFYRKLPPPGDVWRIACFVVASGHRRKGVATAALRAALASIRSQGGGLVEAYPVAIPKHGANTLWFGTVAMFEREGFSKVARLGVSLLMRRRVGSPSKSRRNRAGVRKV